MARSLFAAVAVVALLVPTGTHAQNPRERTLFVSVVDKNGEPVTDLTARDFTVREDKAAREVLRVSRADEPIDIALLVDNSAAIDSNITFMREGLTRFIKAVRREDQAPNQIAIIGLAARPTILADYTSDVAKLTAGIGKVFPTPDTGMTLLDALVETSKGIEKRSAQRAEIVAVVTEGPEHGRYDDRTIIAAMKKAGAGFNAVTVGTFAAITPDEFRYRLTTLTKGTADTGGRHDNLLSATGLPSAMEKLGRQLTSEYKVVYSRPDSLIPPETLEVSVSRPGLSARATPARTAGGQR
jgi:VWFA-related protein